MTDNSPTDNTSGWTETKGKPGRHALLKLLYTHQPLSRSDLTRLMGCHSTTTNRLLEELADLGWVAEQAGRIPKGRRPMNIVLNPQVCFAGIYFAADGLHCTVTDAQGALLWQGFAALHTMDPTWCVAAMQTLRADMTAALLPGNDNAPLENSLKGLGICASTWPQGNLLRNAAEEVFNVFITVEAPGIAYGLYFLHTSPLAGQSRGHLVTLHAAPALELGVLINGAPLRGAHGLAGMPPGSEDVVVSSVKDKAFIEALTQRIRFAVDAYDPGLLVLWGTGAGSLNMADLESQLAAAGIDPELLHVDTGTSADAPDTQPESRAAVDAIINYLFT